MKGLLGKLSKSTGAVTAEVSAADGERLGWKVATFVLERFAPGDGHAIGSSAVWEAYFRWCAAQRVVPLAFAVFHAEFEKVVAAAGITRRQIGAHVFYEGLHVKGEGGA